MKFGDVIIDNFLSIGHAKINLTDRGLMLIQGVNEEDTAADSNGAGKSSVADALCWALFGTTARGVEGDAVVNTEVGKGTSVVVRFVDEIVHYQVTRHRKHKTGKNGLRLMEVDDAGSERADLTLGTDKLTQERLNKILGCSYEVFRAAVYAGQEQMPDLPSMTDKQLKVLVEESSGVTILEEAYVIANARVRTAKETRDAAIVLMDRNQTTIKAIDLDIFLTDGSFAAFELERAEGIEDHKTLVAARSSEAKEFDRQIASRDRAGLVRDIGNCDSDLAAVAGEVLKERELQSALTAAARAEVGTATHLSLAMEQVNKAAHSLDHVDDRLGCPCSECAQPLTAEAIEPARVAAIARHTAFAIDANNAQKRAGDAEAAARGAALALSEHRAGMTDVSSVSALRASLSAKLSLVDKMIATRAATVKQAFDHIEAAKALKIAVNPHQAMRAVLADRLIKAKADAIELAEKAEEAAFELTVTETVAKVFSPAGVRAHVLDDVTPFLNDRTASYLTTLTDGAITAAWTTLVRTAKGELREKFSIEIKKGKTPGFAPLSGGEKRKVRIACALALQDLVARRASKPIDLFIGDEIDDALDAAGLERLMTVLEEKARERASVFIISHRDLKDWISNVVTVVKKAGLSTIVEGALV